MPSTELLTKAPGLLDVEIDRRDWFSEFPEESAFPIEQPGERRRREPATLFTVVPHERPAPIVLPEPPITTPRSVPRPLSLIERVKRAFSPSLTALVIIYAAVIWMTASIGINRRQAENAREAVDSSVTSPATTPVASMLPAA